MNIFTQIKNYRKRFIDVGAHHPYMMNNTALLYKNGWCGVNIEPNPDLYVYFARYRKRDINLNIGISDAQGKVDFFEMSPPSMSTFLKTEAEQLVQRNGYKIVGVKKIEIDTIENVVNNYCCGEYPSFMSLDTEGLDRQILMSINYESKPPIVICAETISFSTEGSGTKDNELIEFVKNKGYFVYADTYINTIFVKTDHWVKHHV